MEIRLTLEQRKLLEMTDPTFEAAKPLVHVPTRDPRPRRQNHLSKKRKLAHQDEDKEVSLDWSGSDQEAEMMEDAQMTFEEAEMEDPQTATEAGLFGRYTLSGTWIFHTFQTFIFTRLTFISPHDL